jgi:hypothetical protein
VHFWRVWVLFIITHPVKLSLLRPGWQRASSSSVAQAIDTHRLSGMANDSARQTFSPGRTAMNVFVTTAYIQAKSAGCMFPGCFSQRSGATPLLDERCAIFEIHIDSAVCLRQLDTAPTRCGA